MADINIGAISEVLNNKMDLDGNNVVASAGASFRNTSNWSNNMTNCITYIPQDINLELNNGTLTLKAGSKVYVPNGSGVFNTVTIINDLTIGYSTSGQTGLGMLFINTSGTQLTWEWANNSYSGTSWTPAVWSVWYDTANNLIKKYGSDTTIPEQNVSFPIALFIRNDGNITSIEQVFNGFGYIGSTIFVLPGVKGLIPNDRNKDGTLKNIETTVLTVQTISGGAPDQKNIYANVRPEGTLSLNGAFKYDEKNNITYNGVNIEPQFLIAKFDNSGGKITNFALLKTVFHAVDYSDFKPVQDHSVIKFQAPTSANSYTWYRKYADGWVEQGGYVQSPANTGQAVTLPITMSDSYYQVMVTAACSATRGGGTNSVVNRRQGGGWAYSPSVVYVISMANENTSSTPVYWQVSGMAA